MAGTIICDRIESDASFPSSINIASPIIVSNTFAIPAGSVGAPALSPVGDTNTGIYFPAADAIGISTNGVDRIRVTSDGNVGIGTSSPDGPLTVVTASDTDGINIRGRTSDNLGSIAFFSNNGVSNYSYIQSTASATTFSTGGATPLTFGTSNGERMRITSGGNVGIGTSSPAVRLHLSSNGEVLRVGTTTNGYVSWYRGATWAGYIDAESGGNMTFANATASGGLNFLTNSASRLIIDSSGNLLVGTTATPTGSSGGSGFISQSVGRRTLYLARLLQGALALLSLLTRMELLVRFQLLVAQPLTEPPQTTA